MKKSSTRPDNPFRINLQQQKKRAKELLKSVKANESQSQLRFKHSHPDFNNNTPSPESIKLSDAQLVIAREFGLTSWAKLKSHINDMSQAGNAINTTIADADYPTLHIRCGTDLQSILPNAGFIGDFLEYTDPYSQGPIILDNNFISNRIKFLHETFGRIINMSLSETKERYENSQHKLSTAAMQYQRIVLWFEHDSFDQLILARILTYFSEYGAPEKLELISIDHFPGSIRFIGLGQLPAEAIRMIWEERATVNQNQLNLAKKIWRAVGESSPEELLKIINSDEINYLPEMHNALQRHIQELPSAFNGLSLTEHLTLEMLNQQNSITAAMLFKKLTLEYDPLPWLGDGMYWFILESMMKVSQPIIEISNEDLQQDWPKRYLVITEAGKKVLAGKQDWLSFKPPARYLGGVCILNDLPCWRWKEEKEGLTIIKV